MAHQRTIRRFFSNGDDSQTERVTVDDDTTVSPLGFVANIVYILFTVLEMVLLIRFILSLGGANRSNQFANAIYNVSTPFVAPFRGLFNVNTTIGGASRFEYEVLIGMLIYALVAAVVIMLLRASNRTIE